MSTAGPNERQGGRGKRRIMMGMAVGVLVAATSILALLRFAAPNGPLLSFSVATPSGGVSAPSSHFPALFAKRFVVERFALPALPALPTPPPDSGVATPTPGACNSPSPVAGSCVPCGTYAGNNPNQSEIAAALQNAAAQYQLPINLLYAVAWQESKWHEDVTSCDGGIGLMQVQYYTYPWVNTLDVPQCGITPTAYNAPATSVQDNAFLGAKYLKWLQCLYAYNGAGGGSSSVPVDGGSAFYYQQAGLAYPDIATLQGAPITTVCPQTSLTPTPSTTATATSSVTPTSSPTATPSPTPSPTPTPPVASSQTASPTVPATATSTDAVPLGSCGLCQTLYQDNGNGPTATLYQDLPSSTTDPWSCPIDPTKGVGDYELLDLVLSAYNAGPGSVSNCSCIPNLDYVGTVEYWVTQFRNGLLPTTF